MSRGFRFASHFWENFVVLGRFISPASVNNHFTCLRQVCFIKWAAKVVIKRLFTRIWIASLVEDPVLFSSGRKVLSCSLTLNKFGTLCCFPQGGKSAICIVRYSSTSLECHAVFLREESLLLNGLSRLDEFRTLCRFSQGGKTLLSTGRLVWLPAVRRI